MEAGSVRQNFQRRPHRNHPSHSWFSRFRGDGLIVKRLRRMMNDRRLNVMKFQIVLNVTLEREFEETKWVIRSHKSTNDRQYNGQKLRKGQTIMNKAQNRKQNIQ